MKSWLKHPVRVTGRLSWLGVELLLSVFSYAVNCAFRPQDSFPMARAVWLQNSARRLLRVFRIETQFTGDIPSSGLLVCNHSSYLDILVLSALAPCVFVAKREVKHWPVFGWFAQLAGTVFVHREQRSQAVQAVDEIEAALQTARWWCFFPKEQVQTAKQSSPSNRRCLNPPRGRLIHWRRGVSATNSATAM